MYNHGIIICLKDSNNLLTIKSRTNNLIHNLNIQYEIKHPISSTIGCFNAHIKALNSTIDILSNNKHISYVIIVEEDIIIDYKSIYYKNLLLCLKQYNKDSDYILHLGGFPTFTNNLTDIFKNDNDKIKLTSRVYLTTGYVINFKIATKLLEILNNSSKHIHCDAIFSHSGIKQYLVKGNIVNQLETYKSNNTIINNFFSTRLQANIFIQLNKISILFIHNNIIFLLLSLISIYKNNFFIILVEFLILQNKFISKLIINKKYNSYLPKNIFTFLEFIILFRIYTIVKLL